MGEATLVNIANKEEVYTLKEGPNVVGRSVVGANDVNIFDPTNKVSRKHCLIEKKEGNYTVKDLDSFRGTYINGKRVSKEEKILSNKDKLGLGMGYILEFRIGEVRIDT